MTTEQRVLAALEANESIWASGMTIRSLAEWTHEPRRVIEALIEELRLRGVPVVADKDGLHLAHDANELARYIEARRRRLASIYQGNRALRKTLEEMKRAEAHVTAPSIWDAA